MDNIYLLWNVEQLFRAIEETKMHKFLSSDEKDELIYEYLMRIMELKSHAGEQETSDSLA